MLIPFDRPLDLASTLESGQAHRWLKESQWYHGVIFNNLVLLKQTSLGIEFHSSPDDEERFEPLLRDYLRLQDDLGEIYRCINIDQRISSAIDRYRGMRLLRQEPWECLIAFICSANSNIPRISATMETLARSFGAPLELEGMVRYTFPTAEALSQAGEGCLRALGLGFRAKYVAGAADTVARGNLDLLALREAPYEEAKETLLALPGVGEKVADCVLAFSLDKLEAFPIDRWVRRALEEWYLNGQHLSYAKLRDWAVEHFGPYAGYAQQYLFHGRRLQGKNTSISKEGVVVESSPF